MQRRTKGSGSVRQFRDNLKQGRVSGTGPDGRSVRISVYAKTDVELEKKMREKKLEIDRGNLANSKVTVSTILKKYMKGQEWAQSTRGQQDIIFNKWIDPYIGEHPAKKLTPAIATHWLQKIREDGCGDRSAQMAYILAKAAFTMAHDWDVIPKNVFKVVKKPSHRHKKHIVATPAKNVSLLLESAKELGHWEVISFALCTGMRWGEICGLTWSDIDESYIHVDKKVSKEGELQDYAKTSSGHRRIPINDIHPSVSIAIERQKRKGIIPIVFPTLTNKHWRYRNFLRDVWQPVCKNAGIAQMGMHEMRHTMASYNIERGMPLVRLSHILGHSKPTVTMDTYGHLVETSAGNELPLYEALQTGT